MPSKQVNHQGMLRNVKKFPMASGIELQSNNQHNFAKSWQIRYQHEYRHMGDFTQSAKSKENLKQEFYGQDSFKFNSSCGSNLEQSMHAQCIFKSRYRQPNRSRSGIEDLFSNSRKDLVPNAREKFDDKFAWPDLFQEVPKKGNYSLINYFPSIKIGTAIPFFVLTFSISIFYPANSSLNFFYFHSLFQSEKVSSFKDYWKFSLAKLSNNQISRSENSNVLAENMTERLNGTIHSTNIKSDALRSEQLQTDMLSEEEIHHFRAKPENSYVNERLNRGVKYNGREKVGPNQSIRNLIAFEVVGFRKHETQKDLIKTPHMEIYFPKNRKTGSNISAFPSSRIFDDSLFVKRYIKIKSSSPILENVFESHWKISEIVIHNHYHNHNIMYDEESIENSTYYLPELQRKAGALCSFSETRRVSMMFARDQKKFKIAYDCEKIIKLADGTIFAVFVDDGIWRTFARSDSGNGSDSVIYGDQLMVDYHSGTRLDHLLALENVILNAHSSGVRALEFGVIRMGVIEGARLQLPEFSELRSLH